MVGIAVAGEKALQPDHVGRVRRPDQDHAATPPCNQSDPAKDQRAHDALAEIGFGDQQRAQPVGRDQQGLDVALGRAVHQRGAAGELADLGQELTRRPARRSE